MVDFAVGVVSCEVVAELDRAATGDRAAPGFLALSIH
jgi:hypothetical protein